MLCAVSRDVWRDTYSNVVATDFHSEEAHRSTAELASELNELLEEVESEINSTVQWKRATADDAASESFGPRQRRKKQRQPSAEEVQDVVNVNGFEFQLPRDSWDEERKAAHWRKVLVSFPAHVLPSGAFRARPHREPSNLFHRQPWQQLLPLSDPT